MIFENRREAGKKLAEKLLNYRHKNAIVVPSSINSIEICAEIAKLLEIPFEIREFFNLRGKTAILVSEAVIDKKILKEIKRIEDYSPKKIVIASPIGFNSIVKELKTRFKVFVLENRKNIPKIEEIYSSWKEIKGNDVEKLLEEIY